MYNPWSVLGFVRKAVVNRSKKSPIKFVCDWINTSSNDILNKLLAKAEMNDDIAKDIDTLENGGSIIKRTINQLTFENMYDNMDSLWMVMLHSGYLTCEKELDNGYLQLRIPNEEILLSFDKLVEDLSTRQASNGKFKKSFCEAVESFDITRMETELNKALRKGTSLRDTQAKGVKENFYHGIMNATLLYRDDWETKSNYNKGCGYSDIMIQFEEKEERWGIVFELKYSKSSVDYTYALNEAKSQIFKRNYAEALKDDNCTVIHLYAIAFHGRKCKIQDNRSF